MRNKSRSVDIPGNERENGRGSLHDRGGAIIKTISHSALGCEEFDSPTKEKKKSTRAVDGRTRLNASNANHSNPGIFLAERRFFFRYETISKTFALLPR